MDMLDDSDSMFKAPSPREGSSRSSSWENVQSRPASSSPPCPYPTVDAFFQLPVPFTPPASHQFGPSSAPQLSRPYLVPPNLSARLGPKRGTPEAFWTSSSDAASFATSAGARGSFGLSYGAELMNSSSSVEAIPPNPGVSPKALTHHEHPGLSQSLDSHQQLDGSDGHSSVIDLGEHHLRRSSCPHPNWSTSSYLFPPEINSTQLKSQDDTLPPLSTLFLGPRSLPSHSQLDARASSLDNHRPFQLRPVRLDEDDSPAGSSQRRALPRFPTPNEPSIGYETEDRSDFEFAPHTELSLSSAPEYVGDGLMRHGVLVTYTEDASPKETQHLRRRCFNCKSTEPPSWRRSALNPGKIVCNRCGLYERTHLRPRPHRFGELHRGTTIHNPRNSINPSSIDDLPRPKRKSSKAGQQHIARRGSVASTNSSSTMSCPDEFIVGSPPSQFNFLSTPQQEFSFDHDIPPGPAVPSSYESNRKGSIGSYYEADSMSALWNPPQ